MSEMLDEIRQLRAELEAKKVANQTGAASEEQAQRDAAHDKEIERLKAEIAYEDQVAALVAAGRGEEPKTEAAASAVKNEDSAAKLVSSFGAPGAKTETASKNEEEK